MSSRTLPFAFSVSALVLVVACGGSTSSDTDTTSGGGGAGAAGQGGAPVAGQGGATAGAGNGPPDKCTAHVTHCNAGKEVSFTCDHCKYVDCDMPDYHVSCGEGSCVPMGQTCGAGGGVGSPCGGKGAPPCSEGTYCSYPDKICGAADGGGACTDQGAPCTTIPFEGKVCGCDGQVYDDHCAAQKAGVDSSLLGGCTAPPDTYRCGDLFCDLGTTYCRKVTSDVGGYADSFSCQPLPPACAATASCLCLQTEPCSAACAKGTDGGFTLTCMGG